jgi:hypothetical protein
MSKGSLSSLQETGEKLDARWAREFAGKPRHTRELDVLDKMIEKADSVVRKARNLTGAAADELRRSASERLQLFQRERAAIAEAQFDKPQLGEVHRLGRQADHAYALWRRHFAGQDRRTRDLGMLDGMIRTLASVHEGLERLAPTQPGLVKAEALPNLAAQLELFRSERNEITKAKKSITGRDVVVCALNEAQQGLDRYRAHFAGQPRITCNADMLAAIVARLDGLLATLEAAPAADLADVQDNLRIVREQRALYVNEVAQVRAAHAAAPVSDASNQLALAANKVFEGYQQNFAGQSRGTRNLQMLSEMCDRLHDIQAQMHTLATAHDDAMARKNEGIVEERVLVYETEWIEIAKAKTQMAEQAAGQTLGTPTKSTTAQAPRAPESLDSLIRIRKD